MQPTQLPWGRQGCKETEAWNCFTKVLFSGTQVSGTIKADEFDRAHPLFLFSPSPIPTLGRANKKNQVHKRARLGIIRASFLLSTIRMAQENYDDEDWEDLGPSKSQLKREQNALQDLGREMTKLGDEQLKRIGLPEEVYVEILEFRRMKSFGAQRRQLQLIGKKMRHMDPVAVREAIDRATGESRAAVALLHRCETLRDTMIESDDAVTKFIDQHPDADIPQLRTLVRNARKEKSLNKPPKSARELYRYLHDLLEEPLALFKSDEDEESDDTQ